MTSSPTPDDLMREALNQIHRSRRKLLELNRQLDAFGAARTPAERAAALDRVDPEEEPPEATEARDSRARGGWRDRDDHGDT